MNLSHRRISPKEMQSLGWTTLPKPTWHFGRAYTHKDGWKISHCGHPTALWPYILEDPDGRMILTGAAVSNRPDFGTAWPSVSSAVDFVVAAVEAAKARITTSARAGWHARKQTEKEN